MGAAGFNPPSLLGAHGLGPFLHNGSAQTLRQVLENVSHRSAGTGGVDELSDPEDRDDLARFLESIDATTRPLKIPETAPAARSLAQAGREALSTLEFRLDLASANPSRGTVTLRFSTPVRTPASLDLFDVQGRRVASLRSGTAEAGVHLVRWDGTLRAGGRAPAGVYLARVRTTLGDRTVRIVRTI